jgi:signal transduction histidine kinase
VIALTYPLISIYYIFPSFSSLVVKNTEDEGVRLARNLMSTVVSERGELKKPKDFQDEIRRIKDDFRLDKVKVFSDDGNVVYSTDEKDIGEMNTRSYFREIVGRGDTHTKFVRKETQSLEGKLMKADVVETYVPIMKNDTFLGAFEIYYDVTLKNQLLKQRIFRFTVIMLALMILFIVVILLTLFRSDKGLSISYDDEPYKGVQSPFISLLIIMAVIFISEGLVMLFLFYFPLQSFWYEVIFDSTLLVFLVSPTLYFFLFRPLIRSIDMHRKAEKKILSYQEQLRTLISRLSVLEEEERRHISEELHDNINQNLALSKIKLASIKHSFPDTAEEIKETSQLIEQTIHFIRNLTFEISPPILYELGFKSAIEWLSEQINRKFGIPVHFHFQGDLNEIKGETAILLFKTVRELLINAVKHARAEKVHLSMKNDDGSLVINVEDNGVGFDTSQIEKRLIREGRFGLLNIREKIWYLGGTFKIESGKGQGMKLTIAVPLKKSG